MNNALGKFIVCSKIENEREKQESNKSAFECQAPPFRLIYVDSGGAAQFNSSD